MSKNTEFESISFDLPKNQSNVIKVIGVGGGGSNAINHMFQAGIKGVDFVICNTDAQALQNSSVPNKIQLGVSLTEGLGAGANPEVGEQAAIESTEDIKSMLGTNTKMVFITAVQELVQLLLLLGKPKKWIFLPLVLLLFLLCLKVKCVANKRMPEWKN